MNPPNTNQITFPKNVIYITFLYTLIIDDLALFTIRLNTDFILYMNICQIKCDFQQIWRTICNSLPKSNFFRVIWRTFRDSLPNNREIQIIWQTYDSFKNL